MAEERARASSYRVVAPWIKYPASEAELQRIRAARERGERVPMAERRVKRVPAGRVVNDIPTGSIPWLLEQGCIEPVKDGNDG